MRVVVSGATGTIGRALVKTLVAQGDEVLALSRNPEKAAPALGPGVAVHAWEAPTSVPPPIPALRGADAVVNLLGEPLAQRWTPAAKDRIRASRVLGTRFLVEGLNSLPPGERPKILVSQSATGFYGPTGEEALDESAPAGHDFLASVVSAWEAEALAAAGDVRVVVSRTGVVLTPDGGALAKMLPFFRFGLGGPVGGGRQYMPWVHLEDVVEAISWCLRSDSVTGIINLTAPQPVTNAAFSRALGRALGRPAVVPVPALGLRMLYGEMAQTVITGQRVVPAVLERLGYEFRHPDVEQALRDALRR